MLTARVHKYNIYIYGRLAGPETVCSDSECPAGKEAAKAPEGDMPSEQGKLRRVVRLGVVRWEG